MEVALHTPADVLQDLTFQAHTRRHRRLQPLIARRSHGLCPGSTVREMTVFIAHESNMPERKIAAVCVTLGMYAVLPTVFENVTPD